MPITNVRCHAAYFQEEIETSTLPPVSDHLRIPTFEELRKAKETPHVECTELFKKALTTEFEEEFKKLEAEEKKLKKKERELKKKAKWLKTRTAELEKREEEAAEEARDIEQHREQIERQAAEDFLDEGRSEATLFSVDKQSPTKLDNFHENHQPSQVAKVHKSYFSIGTSCMPGPYYSPWSLTPIEEMLFSGYRSRIC